MASGSPPPVGQIMDDSRGAFDHPCPDCGAPLGGRAGCDQAFHALGARALETPALAYRRRGVVDAYCLQHPAYLASLKSFAAHLCGLCASIEYANDARADRAIWSDLRLPPGATRPAVPPRRATVTVVAAYAAGDLRRFRDAVDTWLEGVWGAWAEHHSLARQWLEYSMAAPRRRR